MSLQPNKVLSLQEGERRKLRVHLLRMDAQQQLLRLRLEQISEQYKKARSAYEAAVVSYISTLEEMADSE